MPAKKKTKLDDSLSFEKAMEKLEQIVSNLEEGNLGLEDSLTSFESGMALAKVCETKLSEATGRVEKIVKDFSGNEKLVPFDFREEDDEDV